MIFFSKRFVFHNLLGVREKILKLAPDLPKYLVESNKKILVVCRTGQYEYEKNGPKSFFFGTMAFVFEKNLVLSFLDPEKMVI